MIDQEDKRTAEDVRMRMHAAAHQAAEEQDNAAAAGMAGNAQGAQAGQGGPVDIQNLLGNLVQGLFGGAAGPMNNATQGNAANANPRQNGNAANDNNANGNAQAQARPQAGGNAAEQPPQANVPNPARTVNPPGQPNPAPPQNNAPERARTMNGGGFFNMFQRNVGVRRNTTIIGANGNNPFAGMFGVPTPAQAPAPATNVAPDPPSPSLPIQNSSSASSAMDLDDMPPLERVGSSDGEMNPPQPQRIPPFQLGEDPARPPIFDQWADQIEAMFGDGGSSEMSQEDSEESAMGSTAQLPDLMPVSDSDEEDYDEDEDDDCSSILIT